MVGSSLLVGAVAELKSDKPSDLSGAAQSCSKVQQSWGWLNDPLLAGLEVTPVVGADLHAVRTLVRAGAQICAPASALLSGFDAQNPVESMRALGATRLRYLGLETLKQIRKANTALNALDSEQLHFGLGPKVTRFQSVLSEVHQLEPQLKSMVSVGSAVLASKPGSDWLVATQNLAEARGTGGILGSYAVVSLTKSGVKLVEAGSDQTLAKYGPVDYRSLPVDTSLIWGVEPKLWQDLNPSMHAPYTGQQIYDSWLGFKHQKLAGVIFIGQGWAQNLVGLVGPVVVDGTALDASNTADFLAKGIYAKYSDVAKKNDFVKQLMKTLGARLAAGKFDLTGFTKAVQGNQTGDKLFAWSTSHRAQKALIADSAAGYVDGRLGNRVWVGVNNGGGNKIDAYISASIDYRVEVPTAVRKRTSVSNLALTLTNKAPKTGLPAYVNGRLDLAAGTKYKPGSNIDLVSVYLPIGANLSGFLVNNQPFSVHDDVDRGRELVSFRIELDPGESKRLWLAWNLEGKYALDSRPLVTTNSSFSRDKVNLLLRKSNR